MAKRTGLGKGLGALIGDTVVEKDPAGEKSRSRNKKTEEKDDTVGREMFIKISSIEPNQAQPRKKFDEEQLNELADSIKQYGILQPLLVQKNGNFYEIITGERRWRAAKMAGLKEVPVVIREYSAQQKLEIALIENVQREDLNPIEEAMAYQRLIEEFHLKQDEIAARVAKNRTTITNSVRLLKLHKDIQAMVAEGIVSSGHARALLVLEDQDDQLSVAQKIVKDGLSVRETERLVKALTKPKQEKTKEKEPDAVILAYQNMEDRMKSIMGTKVSINRKDKNKGRIEIEYYSSAELERIIELIESIKQY